MGDETVWTKATERRTGKSRDGVVVEKVRKDGGNQDMIVPIGIRVGDKTKVRDMAQIREERSLRQRVDVGEHLNVYGG